MKESEANTRRLQAGQRLATPICGDEVVISGISGSFPNSRNVSEFKENLLNKVDLCDDDNRRWVHTHAEIPRISGKIYDAEKFDIGFFGVHPLQVNFIDPMCRLFVESAYEAFVDAGLNPEDFKGSNTGVFVGTCYSESEKTVCYEHLQPQGYGIMGSSRSMIAQRVSYCLQLNGPSQICDSACSSGLYAFEQAYRAIREGRCENALVGATNLCFNPYVTLQFARLGVLNMNVGCKPFDQNASGYTRSEAIAVLLLQKKNIAKRVYSTVVHCKVNVDGYKELGITYPSGDSQILLLRDIYEECNISPKSLAFVEAHGTGTKVGDPEELNAMDKFFCADRKIPLYIGSIKGNIGHTEPVSGLCSLIKVIYAMEDGIIPPNIHFDTPRADIEGIIANRLQVLTEPTSWPEHISQLAGLSCFGFGGSNCHLLLKRSPPSKQQQNDNLPRLVCFSGRSKDCIECYQNYLKYNPLNYEFVRLIHEVYRMNIPSDNYRGYSVVDLNGEIFRSFKENFATKPLYLCLGASKQSHVNMLQELAIIPFFRRIIQIFQTALSRNSIHEDLSSSNGNTVYSTIALHVCIITFIKELELPIASIRCSSLGELTGGFAAGVLTLDEVILATEKITKLLSANVTSNLSKKLLVHLSEILPAKPRKPTIPVERRKCSMDYASPEYFVFNILNPGVLGEFDDNGEGVNICLNFDKKMLKSNVLEFDRDGMKFTDMLINIGALYEEGFQPLIHKIYPQIQWPVSRGTPMLSPFIKWKHEKNYYVPRAKVAKRKDGEKISVLSILNSDLMFYKGHVIDGRNLFPATGYLFQIWDFYASMKGFLFQHMKICFEGVKFHRATAFTKDDVLNFYLVIHHGGYFEVSQSGATVVSGRIFEVEEIAIDYQGKPNDPSLPTLKEKDIYKELRLRGYNYRGAFRAIKELSGNNALIEWNDNWITFLDNMLQLYIIKEDTRSLYVPTGIEYLVIDARSHMDFGESLGEEKYIPVEIDPETNITRSKYIEIRGVVANSIPRKKTASHPVLESYEFVPNRAALKLAQSIRVNMQILLEMKPIISVKVLEVLKDSSIEIQPFCVEILKVLSDLPLIQPDIVFCTNNEWAETKGITKTEKISDQTNNILFVGSNIMENPKLVQQALSTTTEDGFLISIETISRISPPEYTILTEHLVGDYFVYLMRKTRKPFQGRDILQISEDVDSWLPNLQSKLKTSNNILLYAENDENSGILGLVNALRREPYGERICCCFLQESSGFDINNHFFKEQLNKGMPINVLRGNIWGTYRHLLLDEYCKIDAEHAYADVLVRGDLTTWNWIQGPLGKEFLRSNRSIVQIYYSAINFRDLMMASGRIPVDSVSRNRIEQQRIQGFEFSGKNSRGERVMGLIVGGAISNMIEIDPVFVWKIPDNWTLEEAATVPVVYATVLYAFQTRCNMKEGQTILIHAGTGGIGHAAIIVSHHLKLNIFTTVGSQVKKDYIMKEFPFIKPSQIGNSRDTSFEQMVFKETNGRGVNYVLNSLSEEKLEASVRCIANGGTFLEIGKFDIASNNRLQLDILAKGASYHGIMLDTIKTKKAKRETRKLIYKGIQDGYVKPLPRKCFEMDQLEETFRYIGSGKHIGKVLIKIREEDNDVKAIPRKIKALPRIYCEPNASYVILGGLGGFGLELADWLILRGAKYLVLSSRKGPQTAYQESRLRMWKTYGVNVIISTENISEFSGCQKLLKSAVAPIAIIFNLAVVLQDALIENQTVQAFKDSFAPKAIATVHLDKITRKFYPNLKHFVVFSSVSCGRGNAGQTNYAMSNSIMERICEKRKKDNFPGLAIQWGAIGDVGLIAEMQKEHGEIAIGGTLQQRISSCLDVLDNLLHQNEAIVSSIVVAEKSGLGNADNMVDAVINIMGLRDLKTISLHSTLAELGMDSMMAVEIKQTLERDYDVFLSPQDMRSLSFSRLMELNDSKEGPTSAVNILDSFKMLITQVYNPETFKLPFVFTKGASFDGNYPILFPGLEGTNLAFGELIERLDFPSICVQYKTTKSTKNLQDLIENVWESLKEYLLRQPSFNFVAHSYGSIFAIEMANRLEKNGIFGKIFLIDGSPYFIRELFKLINATSEAEIETAIMIALMSTFTPMETVAKLSEKILLAENFKERQNIVISNLGEDIILEESRNDLLQISWNIFNMIKFITEYTECTVKMKSKMVLYKPSLLAIKNTTEDYNLNTICENPVEIYIFDGNHQTVLNDENLANHINNLVKT